MLYFTLMLNEKWKELSMYPCLTTTDKIIFPYKLNISLKLYLAEHRKLDLHLVT